MKKSNRSIVIFLIIIIALPLNYLLYQYIFLPKYSELKSVEEDYKKKESKLEELIKIKGSIDKEKEENQVLKKEAEEIEKLIAREIDTPQLVYDFYKSCQDYDISGEEVKFSLAELEPGKEEDITTLEIILKVNGEKSKIEKYIKSLDKITQRKLNVKSIRLSSRGLGGENEGLLLLRGNNIESEITFYHYMKLTNEEVNKLKEYKFYPNIIGFDSIPAMFR